MPRAIRNHLVALLLASPAALAGLPAEADDGVDSGQTITIPGPKNPVLLPYRYMLAGLDAFDDNHELAPTAKVVRFRLRGNAGDDATDDLTLAIVGGTTTIPVQLAADGSFVLPRSEAAADEDADLMLNKSKRGYSWVADVRSEGVPDGMRRLGDLRLECAVMTAIGKKALTLMMRLQITALVLTSDWCTHKNFKYSGRSEETISGATLVWRDQRLALKVRSHGKSYSVPTGNNAFPDDALIEFNTQN